MPFILSKMTIENSHFMDGGLGCRFRSLQAKKKHRDCSQVLDSLLPSSAFLKKEGVVG